MWKLDAQLTDDELEARLSEVWRLVGRGLYRVIRGRPLEALALLTRADRLLHAVLHWLTARARAQGKSRRGLGAATGTNGRNAPPLAAAPRPRRA